MGNTHAYQEEHDSQAPFCENSQDELQENFEAATWLPF